MTATEIEPEVEERPPTWWQRAAAGSATQIGLILVGLIVIFSILEPENFTSVNNARNIATDAAVLLVIATGMTYVIITAGIDLSVGSVLVFSGVIAAKLMNEVGGDNWGVILVGLAAALASGLAWGLVNGFLVAKAKIPAFIVTLGTFGMALGLALVISGGVDERSVPFKLISTIGIGRLFSQIPYLVIISLAVALVFGVILAQTRFGRYTYFEKAKELGLDYVGRDYSNDKPETAAAKVKAALAKNPDIKGIFATNLFSAEGAATGVREAGAKGVNIVGFDAGPKQVEDLKSGVVQALIAQKPAEIGADGIEQAYNALTGKSTTAKIATGFTSITKDNLDQNQDNVYKASC